MDQPFDHNQRTHNESSASTSDPSSPASLGEPYCSNCKYVLTGVVDSARCPECGLPLVEVLVRRGREVSEYRNSRRFRSKATILGLPAIDVAFGPSEDNPRGKARGFLAIGTEARGVVAIGGQATGGIAIGGGAMGVCSVGGGSLGVISFGGGAVGVVACGGGAVGIVSKAFGSLGFIADGMGVVGYYARGFGVVGKHVTGRGNSAAAQSVFDSAPWFFGTWPPSIATILQGPLMLLACFLLLAGGLSIYAWLKHSRHGTGNVFMGPE